MEPFGKQCQEEKCIQKYEKLKNSKWDGIKSICHCNSCHVVNIECFGHICTTCDKWICEGCHRTNNDKRNYCPKCFDVILLRRCPRRNFHPGAPIEVEEQYINPPVFKKPKTLPLEEQKGKTLAELAFMPWPDIKPTTLAKKHPHELDDTIWLDETNKRHIYHVKYDKDEFETEFNQSTSTMVHTYFPNSYDPYEAIDAMLGGKEWGPNHPKYGAKYYSDDENVLVKNLRQLLVDWGKNNEEAIESGKFVHFLIECHFNDQLDLANHPVYNTIPNIQQYLKWREEHFDPFYEAYRTEFRAHTDKTKRKVGTGDLFAVRKNHPPPSETNGTLYLTMFDWKNCILKMRGFKKTDKGIKYCAAYDKCNYEEYTLQQNEYERLVTDEKMYTNFHYNGHVYKRVRFEEKYLIVFHETNPKNKAIIVPLEDRQDVLEHIWRDREEEVAKWEKAGRPKPPPYIPKPKLSDQEEEAILHKLIQKHKLAKKEAFEWERFKNPSPECIAEQANASVVPYTMFLHLTN